MTAGMLNFFARRQQENPVWHPVASRCHTTQKQQASLIEGWGYEREGVLNGGKCGKGERGGGGVLTPEKDPWVGSPSC